MTKFTRRQFNPAPRSFAERLSDRLHLRHAPLQIILLGVIVFASLSYLFYINQTATGGFDMKGMEGRITELQKENKKLELRVAELQSLSAIETASADMHMVAASNVEYLPAVGAVVAQR